MQGFGGRFNILFYLPQAELIGRSFIPLRLAFERVKVKTVGFRLRHPIGAGRELNTLHGGSFSWS